MKTNLLTTVLTTGLLVVASSAGMAGDAFLQTFRQWSDSTDTFAVARPCGSESLRSVPWQPRLQSAPGTVIRVTTREDELLNDGDCSLREAIEAANTDLAFDACPAGYGQDTVVVPKGTYRLSIPGANEDENQTGDLDMLDDLVLVGEGAGRTILDGGRLDRILEVHPGRTVEIHSVTVTHGLVYDTRVRVRGVRSPIARACRSCELRAGDWS